MSQKSGAAMLCSSKEMMCCSFCVKPVVLSNGLFLSVQACMGNRGFGLLLSCPALSRFYVGKGYVAQGASRPFVNWRKKSL